MQLSDKVKGKRRETYELEDVTSTTSETPNLPTELTVRFTEGIPDVTFSIDGSYTVKDVKILIREYRPALFNRRLRLIHQGKLLSDSTFVQRGLSKSTVSTTTEPSNEEETPLVTSMNTAWVHCAVGPVITPEEDAQMPEQTTQITPLRGFDRLQASGLSETEIANIRRQFHAESGLGGENLLDIEFADDAEYEEYARGLEEQWLDSLDGTGSSLQTNTSSASVTQGLFLGFFFPIMPFFFFFAPREPIFWEDGRDAERPRSVVFSVRTQVAIVFGLAVNLIFGLYRMLVSGS